MGRFAWRLSEILGICFLGVGFGGVEEGGVDGRFLFLCYGCGKGFLGRLLENLVSWGFCI